MKTKTSIKTLQNEKCAVAIAMELLERLNRITDLEILGRFAELRNACGLEQAEPEIHQSWDNFMANHHPDDVIAVLEHLEKHNASITHFIERWDRCKATGEKPDLRRVLATFGQTKAPGFPTNPRFN